MSMIFIHILALEGMNVVFILFFQLVAHVNQITTTTTDLSFSTQQEIPTILKLNNDPYKFNKHWSNVDTKTNPATSQPY